MSDENEKKETPEPSPEAAKPEAAEAAPAAEAKAEEAKPAEAKAADAKPAEAKAEEAKPAEAKAADAKPAEGGADEAKATEAKPAEGGADDKGARGRGRGRGGERGGRGGRDGGGRGRRGDRESTDGLYEKVVKINRTAKVVKGGRRFSFSVLGVVGDQKGRVGVGLGKANGVPAAIKKALEKARQNMVTVPLSRGRTIPYPVEARFSGARMIMRPATPGTGIIAGGACRALIEAVGIQDILTKRIGSSNPGNVLRATLRCFEQMKAPKDVARLRGVSVHQLFNGHDAPAPEAEAPAEAEA